MSDAIAKSISGAVPGARSTEGGAYPGVRERLLRRLLARLQVGRIHVILPSGRCMTVDGIAPGPEATVRIRNWRLVNRILLGGDMGVAEGYMAGDWDSPDLAALLDLSLRNERALTDLIRQPWPVRLLARLRHALHANTPRGSRRNIAVHYDLGNAFYGHWLDETMSYSSALFETPDEPMADGQRRKYERLALALNLRPGDHVLEIGCGWGGFAEIAARDFGCRVTGLTLSREQAIFARTRMADLGLDDQVDIRIQDYRAARGTYDKIASIEMFEAVGEAYWPTYLNTLKARLAPGGRAGLQIITIDDAHFESYRRSPDFIQRYIFPGGMLPGPNAFADAVARAGLRLTDAVFFGPSYAETLRRWDVDFLAAWPEIEKLGFDERFRRMWHYYLKYCEAGFDAGRINVGQFVIDAG
jgi:cyclopropane-fatty-acyl-phospholipid synthase